LASVLQSNAAHDTTGNVSSYSLQFASNVGAGSGLFAIMAANNSSGAVTFTAADNIYGSYNVDEAFSGTAQTVAIASLPGLTGLGGTQPTVTATIASGPASVIFLWIIEVSQIASTPFDVGASNNSTSSVTSGTTGTTASLAQVTEIAFAVLKNGANDSSLVVSSPFTPLATVTTSSGTGAVGYLFTSSNAAQSATFTWTTASTYRSAIATYKLGSAVAQPPKPIGGLPRVQWHYR
jgi:hypothetical protein